MVLTSDYYVTDDDIVMAYRAAIDGTHAQFVAFVQLCAIVCAPR